MSNQDVLVYILFFTMVVTCIVKVGMLVRVRTGLLDIPPAERKLMTILADNNLAWCLLMVLVGTMIIARLLNLVPAIVTRFIIMFGLVLSSAVGLVRLGNWFVWDDGATTTKIPKVTALTLDQEIVRLIQLLEQERRRRGEVPDG